MSDGRVESGTSDGRRRARAAGGSRHPDRAAALLSAAGATLALLLFSAACVVPPDIEAPPAETPRGPVIVLDKVEPKGLVNIGSACRQDFTAGEIEDENTGDTIYYRWFVDYYFWGIYKASGKLPAAADGSEKRQGPAYTLDATSSLVLNDRTAGSVHTVELIVADRPFEEDSTIQPAFKVVTAGGYWAYYSWTVKLKTDCSSP